MSYYSYSPRTEDRSGELLGRGVAAAGEGIAAAIQKYGAQRDETERMRAMLEGIPDISPEILQKFESGSRGAKAGVFASAVADYQRRQEEEARKQQEALQLRMAAIRGASSRREQPELSAPAVMTAEDGSSWYINPRTGSPMKQVQQPEAQLPPSVQEMPVLGPDGQPTGRKYYVDQNGSPIPPQYVQQPEMDMTDPSARPPGMSLGDWEVARRKKAGIKADRPSRMPSGPMPIMQAEDGRPYYADPVTGRREGWVPGWKPGASAPAAPADPLAPAAPATPPPNGVTGRIKSLSSMF